MMRLIKISSMKAAWLSRPGDGPVKPPPKLFGATFLEKVSPTPRRWQSIPCGAEKLVPANREGNKAQRCRNT
jgi:hypothetical protein